MNLFKKLFSREKEVKVEQVESKIEQPEQYFKKEDIVMFLEIMDEPTLREQNDYVKIGYFNNEHTRFKNILTNVIFDYNDVENMITLNKREFKVIKFKRDMEDRGDSYFWMWQDDVGDFPLLLKYSKERIDYSRFTYLLDFLKNDDPLVTLTQIKKIKKELTTYVGKRIEEGIRAINFANEQKNRQTLYSKDF